MFSFTQEQKVYDIAGISIGGQPGRYPTVLFGGVFFKGTPDYDKASQDLKNMYKQSIFTGVPAIPDFFIRHEEDLEKIIDFINTTIPKNSPFSIDIIDSSIKIQTLRYLDKKHLLSRTIYNSIHIGITDEEQEALQQHTPEMAIIVAFNPKDTSPDGKIEVLENGAHLLDSGLLDLSKKLRIKKTLVDTAALAPGENSGAAIAALPVIKEEYGLPSGCAIHNVVEKSKWLKKTSSSRQIVDAASNINIPLFSGDYALFGPIEHAELVFPIIAWQDILISEYTEQYFGIQPVETHPRRKLLE